MGILTLLRNAFGRSRKGRDADAETLADGGHGPHGPGPGHRAGARAGSRSGGRAKDPAPSSEPSVVDELVSAAFDNVTVPDQAEPVLEEKTTEETKETAEKADGADFRLPLPPLLLPLRFRLRLRIPSR